MRPFIVSLAVLTLALTPFSASAEDGWGSYFYNQGSAGFGNPIDKSNAVASNTTEDTAEGVAAIEPAAGEETVEQPKAEKKVIELKINNKKNAQDLQNIQGEIEKALGAE